MPRDSILGTVRQGLWKGYGTVTVYGGGENDGGDGDHDDDDDYHYHYEAVNVDKFGEQINGERKITM